MNHTLFRGSLEPIILKLLTDHGALYGYAITQLIKEQSDGSFNITEGALYPTLHRLESKGILQSETKKVGNRNRKYYTLSKRGKSEAKAAIDSMEAFIHSLQHVFKPSL